MHGNPDDYKRLRNVYAPDKIRAVVIAESPPARGLYFYDISGKTSEPLFAALTKEFLGRSFDTKKDGLKAFCDGGYMLIDATYKPVNKRRDRDEVIEANYPNLLEDLKSLSIDATVPLILVKENVCRLLESKLTADGFWVANRGRVIYFPSTGHVIEFRDQIRPILYELGLSSSAEDSPRVIEKQSKSDMPPRKAIVVDAGRHPQGGSISAVAKDMNCSTTNVKKQIKQCEDKYGSRCRIQGDRFWIFD